MFNCDVCGCEISYSPGEWEFNCPGCKIEYSYAEGPMPVLTEAMKTAILSIAKVQDMRDRRDGICDDKLCSNCHYCNLVSMQELPCNRCNDHDSWVSKEMPCLNPT
jgi:hypothetical protein